MLFQFLGPPQKRGFGCACVLCLPRLSGSGSQRLGRPLPGTVRLFPPQLLLVPVGCLRLVFVLRSWPLAATLPVADVDHPESQEFLNRNRGPVCSVGGGGFSGAEFAPFSSPPPPTSSGDGAALLWRFSVPLFCEPAAVCSGRSIFLSLSHSLKKSPSDCSQGLRAGPYPKECRRLLSVPPPLAGGGCGRLGVLFCWESLLGM